MNNRITRNAAIIQLLFVSMMITIVMLFRQYQRTDDLNYSSAMYWVVAIGGPVLAIRILAFWQLVHAHRKRKQINRQRNRMRVINPKRYAEVHGGE